MDTCSGETLLAVKDTAMLTSRGLVSGQQGCRACRHSQLEPYKLETFDKTYAKPTIDKNGMGIIVISIVAADLGPLEEENDRIVTNETTRRALRAALDVLEEEAQAGRDVAECTIGLRKPALSSGHVDGSTNRHFFGVWVTARRLGVLPVGATGGRLQEES